MLMCSSVKSIDNISYADHPVGVTWFLYYIVFSNQKLYTTTSTTTGVQRGFILNKKEISRMPKEHAGLLYQGLCDRKETVLKFGT